ncbi:MAG: glycosyltransferase [Bacteroidetes bacterium]|nr:glycosyltransferase [Bacteroidota bacterium]
MELPVPELSLLFILFSLYALVFIDQMIYYWFIFGRLAFYKSNKRAKKAVPVSIVLCAKDEYNNLRKNLPLILEQEYPDFEVVVANDASTDETKDLLQGFEREYPNLSIVDITKNLNFFSGKKFALSLGIKSAKHEWLLLTDANCKPISNQWLKNMALAFTAKTDVVLGYAPFKATKGILNTLIRFDNLYYAIQYLSYALIGKPFTGVGRNLAYRKSLFYKSQGFISHYKLVSGDDGLFVNSVATKKNTDIKIGHDSYTLSDSKSSLRSWILKRRRQSEAARYYNWNTRFLLRRDKLSQLLFYGLLMFLLLSDYNIIIVLSLFGLRLLSQLFIIKKCMINLNERGLLLISPLLEILLILIRITLLFTNLFTKKNKWK